MCLSRGCVDGQERHNSRSITMADLTEAAADAGVEFPQLIANLAAGVGIKPVAERGNQQPDDLSAHEHEPVKMSPSLGPDFSGQDEPLEPKTDTSGGDLHPRPQPAVWMT